MLTAVFHFIFAAIGIALAAVVILAGLVVVIIALGPLLLVIAVFAILGTIAWSLV